MFIKCYETFGLREFGTLKILKAEALIRGLNPIAFISNGHMTVSGRDHSMLLYRGPDLVS